MHERGRFMPQSIPEMYVSFDGENEMDQMDDAKLRKREKKNFWQKS